MSNLRSQWIIPLCFAGIAIAQVQPIYRVGTRLVTVDVTVHSDKGAVKGLSKEDFILQDKGKTQPIAVFAMTEAGAAPATKPEPLPPNVSSNRMNNGGEMTQSATVVLFDRLNTPAALDQANVRTRVLAMLTSLKPTDRVGFYSLGTSLTMVQDFNEDADRMVQAAKRLGSGQGAAPSDARSQQVDAALKEAMTPIQQQDIRLRVPTTQQALQTIARHLAGIPGRKNLVWVLSDFPLTYGEDASRRANYDAEVALAGSIMADANVAVYPMDPRGVTTSSSTSSGATNDNSSGAEQAGRLMKGANAASSSSTTALGQSGTETVDSIAKATGGTAYHNTNDLAGDVRKVLAESEVSYTLGFYVEDKALDGKSHDLTVKLVNKPETKGATPRYKKSYMATPPQAALKQRPGLSDLIRDAFDATEVGVMAATAPDPNKPGMNLVQVRVTLGDVQFEHRADKWVGAIELGMAIEDMNGKATNAVTVPTPLNFSDEQLKKGLVSGMIIDSSAPAPAQPGRLRIVILDKTSGAAGSVRIPISK
ncbi:MAG TPA: VWA domain-containing protein [Bryobacteraceae bacterium]|jgi:VWFA-related protein